ncbi:hypothetical protein DL767_001259 [Monosporascus sp. MG133]|nr:hypothetical protein DL767_001259 [Monosporascus sp. MG133]
MASSNNIDLSAILAALHGMERKPNNRVIKQYLLAKGIPESIATPVAMNELCYWSEEEVGQIFRRLHATVDDISNPQLKSFEVKLSTEELAADLGPTDFIKPSWNLVVKSAAALGALCVNRDGEFRVNPPGGFAALSHVWSQGLGSDAQGRGLHRSLIQQIFAKVGPLGIKWVWTDSLAIPGGGEELSFVEEEMKAMLINAMADIYRKANQVIIFDALVLRLASLDAVDTAVALCLGKWLTRVWTYQEIKLATNAIVANNAGFVRFAEIVDTLRSKAHDEVGEGYDTHQEAQFPSMFRTFHRLQRNDQLGVSLPDIAIGCGYREAHEKLDYARSIFPTLGMPWRFGDNIEDAMKKVYEAQKRHAMRLVLYHGPPRASYPGWAPAVFPGLVDSKVITPGTWKLRGMSREWLTSKVKSIVPSKPGCVILELDNQLEPGAYSACNISPAMERQSPKSVELFREAVKNGTAYLLSDEPLIPKRHSARVGLLVEKFTKSPGNEAWVCLTLAIGETEPSYRYERQNWLLLHENPASDTGKQSSELNYLLERSPEPAPSGFQMESRLHAAARDGDITALQSITNSPGYVDINPQDSRGWTPLHYAAAAGQVLSIRALVSHGANLAIPTRNDETPLVLAVDNAHQDAVCELVDAGADANAFAPPRGPSPLVTATRKDNIEMVRLLLLLGADPSLEDGYNITPLMSAAYLGRGGTDLEVLRELIDAEAHVDAIVESGLTALEAAVRGGNVPAARALLAHGAEPNGRNPALESPLQHAIEARDAEMVAALLDYGAEVGGPGARFKSGWTAMMCAAEAGDVPIGRLLKSRKADMFATAGKEKWTPLHVAAVKGNKLFFKWLVEEGQKEGHPWSERDYKGRTAFQVKKGDE